MAKAAISLLHLSDTHILKSRNHSSRKGNPAAGLRRSIEHALSMRVQWSLAIISGDLVESGHPDEYEALRHELQPLAEQLPIYFCLGNHDSREGFRQVFGDFWDAHVPQYLPWLQYSVDLGNDQQLVVLDTLWDGHPTGKLCTERLNWLADTLSEFQDKSILLALHHPPFLFGNTLFDGMAVVERDRLAEMIGQHPQIERLICGHVHRTMMTILAQRAVYAAPSTFHAYGVDYEPGHESGVSDEAPGFSLHQWMPESGWISHSVFTTRPLD